MNLVLVGSTIKCHFTALESGLISWLVDWLVGWMFGCFFFFFNN